MTYRLNDREIYHAIFEVFANRNLSRGTCFLIGENQTHFMTALHVVRDYSDIFIHIGKTPIPARVRQRFDNMDVAIIEVDSPIGTDPLPLSSMIKVNSQTRIAGYPQETSADWILSRISGESNSEVGIYQIGFDSAQLIHLSGLSGGPVLDTGTNEVVGVFIRHKVEEGLGEIASLAAFKHLIKLDPISQPDCYVVLSEAERELAKNDASSSLMNAVKEALDVAARKTDLLSRQPRSQENYATDLVSSREAFTEAIKMMCSAKVVVFDMTHNEPAIMLLLGIRSVVRRGVTICTVGGDYIMGDVIDFPFVIKEISHVFHSEKQRKESFENPSIHPSPSELIGERISTGLKEHQYQHYLDLPAFDAVRRLLPSQRAMVPDHIRILVLCSYSEQFNKINWLHIRNRLLTAKEPAKPKISRVVDLSSPQLVSSSIYEAIRQTSLCIIDWSEWRHNVFYEFGVRAAVGRIERGTVIILDERSRNLVEKIANNPDQTEDILVEEKFITRTNSQFKEIAARFRLISNQCIKLMHLFAHTKYKPQDYYSDVFTKLISYYNGVAAYLPERHSGLVPAYVYNIVSEHIDANGENFTKPVYQDLLEQAELLAVNETDGNPTLLYPENRELYIRNEHAITDRLIAAWSFIKTKYSVSAIQKDASLRDQYIAIGTRLLSRLDDKNEEYASIYFMIKKEIEKYEISGQDPLQTVQTLKDEAKARSKETQYKEAQASILQALDILLPLYEGFDTSLDEPNELRDRIRKELADCYGILGGIYNRQEQFERAARYYEQGKNYEVNNTYNLSNYIVNSILFDASSFDAQKENIGLLLLDIDRQIRENRETDFWAWADFGQFYMLYGNKEQSDKAYNQFIKLVGADKRTYNSHIRVLNQLASSLDFHQIDIANMIKTKIKELEIARDRL